MKKPTEYYMANKDLLKEKRKNKYWNILEEENEVKREYSQNRYKNIKERVLKQLNIIFLYSIKMSGKTLKFDNIEVNKQIQASKQPIDLNLVDINKQSSNIWRN